MSLFVVSFSGVYTSHLNHARPLRELTLALVGGVLRVNESRDVALAWLRFASSSASLGPLSERWVLVALGGSWWVLVSLGFLG